jgi:hypothetical protein
MELKRFAILAAICLGMSYALAAADQKATSQPATAAAATVALQDDQAPDPASMPTVAAKPTKPPEANAVFKEGEQGGAAGIVVEKGDNWFSIVTTGVTLKFTAPWVGDASGGFDKQVLKQIAALKGGEYVRIKWRYHERLLALDVTVSGGQEKADANFTEGQAGTLSGTITDRGDTWVVIKTDGDKPQTLKFMPRWVGLNPDQGGGFEKQSLTLIKTTPIGAKVKVEWVFQERLRIVKLTALAQ